MKSKSKGVIGGTVLGLVLAGVGAFGAIKGFGLRVVKEDQVEDVAVKYNYKKVDFANDSKSTIATVENLSQLFKTSEKDNLITSVSDTTGKVFLDGGGVRLGTTSESGSLYLNFETGFDHYQLNIQAYNQPVYVDSEKDVTEVQYDNNGEAIVQKWNCDYSRLSYSLYPDSETINYFTLSHNNDEIVAPKIDSVLISPITAREKQQDCLELVSVYFDDLNGNKVFGRIILLSFEAWNDTDKTAVETTPEEDVTSASASTSASA